MSWTNDGPTEEAINALCEITGIDRNQAITRLKANSNNADRAASEFFDDPSGKKYSWDESAFGADRQGESNGPGISFNIQGPDDLGRNSAAPTRPSSRTNNRSPLGRLVDLTAFEAAGAPSSSVQEDADLQRALAESAAESGLPHQEIGIIDNDANVTHFGPATRPDYERDQWAMVPTKAEAAQEKSQPKPSARKRDPAAPAFLRTVKNHRLGGIVSILHKIPLARNILLSSGVPARSYGHNSEWWKGQPILKPENLEAMARGEERAGDPDFNEELHRLVAFLDNTERSYGSIDILAETDAIDPSHGAWMPTNMEGIFFEALAGTAINGAGMEPMQSVAKTDRITSKTSSEEQTEEHSEILDVTSDEITTDSDMWDIDDNNGNDYGNDGQQAIFACLDIDLSDQQSPWINSLYDALDSLFWSNAFEGSNQFPDQGSRTAFLSKVGEIMTFRITNQGLSKFCEVPVVLYLDRYLENRKDVALTSQTELSMVKSLLMHDIPKREKQLLTCNGDTGCRKSNWFNGQSHSARDCWEKVIKDGEEHIRRQKRSAQWRYVKERMSQDIVPSLEDIWLIHTGDLPYELSDQEKEAQAKLEPIIEISKQKIEELQQDLDEIRDRREQCYLALDVISKRLTCREEDADAEFAEKYILRSQPKLFRPDCWDPTHKYILRGVSTTHEISYICTRREPDLIDIEGQSDPVDQWWRVVYAAQETTPLSVKKTDLDTVLLAAGTESKTPILVYASEAAMTTSPIQLSDALRMFVRADNRSFQHEIAQENQSQTQDMANDQGDNLTEQVVPLTVDAVKSVSFASPAKRKHSSAGSSVATIASSSNSRDLDIAFSDDNTPNVVHQEHASPSPQYNKLGGIVETLQNCRTHEGESPVLGRREFTSSNDHQGVVEMQSIDSYESASKNPEMQERSGGPAPFISRLRKNADNRETPVDMMDMDLDS